MAAARRMHPGQRATCAAGDCTQEGARINHPGAAWPAMPIGRVWRQIGGSRVGCHCESATLCNQHQARMSKQADAPVSMRPCLAGQGRGRCSS